MNDTTIDEQILSDEGGVLPCPCRQPNAWLPCDPTPPPEAS